MYIAYMYMYTSCNFSVTKLTMKYLIASVYNIFIIGGLVTSQECPNCPVFVAGGGLAIAGIVLC